MRELTEQELVLVSGGSDTREDSTNDDIASDPGPSLDDDMVHHPGSGSGGGAPEGDNSGPGTGIIM